MNDASVCGCTNTSCGPDWLAAPHTTLIVFDLDGTIADSRELARMSFKRVFALMGYGEITDELADSFNGPDADEVCRVMGIGPDRRVLYDQLVDETDAQLVRTDGRMFPGTVDMLANPGASRAAGHPHKWQPALL